MKAKVFLLIITLFFLVGCGRASLKVDTLKTSYKILEKTVRVDVSLDTESLQHKDKIKEVLVSKAGKDGVLKVVREWLNKSLLFKMGEVKKYSFGKEMKLNIEDMMFKPFYDKLTQVYSGSFKCYVKLDPRRDFLGIITGIEGGFSLATFHIVIELCGVKPVGDTYFIIARKNDFNVGSLYQMIGLGKIYNVIGKIAQGEIITSTQEIKRGDLIFLLYTKISPVLKKQRKEVRKKQNIPVIDVYPVMEKKEVLPKEMK